MLKKVLKTSHVFARMSPEDKMRLTKLCKEMNLIIGVTGDGVNDTLALKAADVGIAMGENGSDVAREASDIVLTNDSFSVIVSAVEEGRTIYANIVKALVYLLAGNLSELMLIFGAFIFHLPFPLLPTQVLWVNLITDGLPALALANDNKHHKVMQDKPRSQNVPILTRRRLTFIILTGILLGGMLVLLFSLLLQANFGELKSRTVVFNFLIFSHLFLAITIHKRLFSNPNWFLIITVIITTILQLTITFVPFFENIFHLGLL